MPIEPWMIDYQDVESTTFQSRANWFSTIPARSVAETAATGLSPPAVPPARIGVATDRMVELEKTVCSTGKKTTPFGQ